MLDKMELLEDPSAALETGMGGFRFNDPVAARVPQLVSMTDVSFGYHDGQEDLLESVSVCVSQDARIGICGANGVGKSTLLKLVSGTLEPRQGKVELYRGIRVASFAQHHTEQLPSHLDPVQCLQAKDSSLSETECRCELARFGLLGQVALTPVRCLSGGQRSRLVLCIASHVPPHLLILDEPTNHLDADSIDALIEAIGHYSGAVVLVSHDLYFLERVVREYWAVARARVHICHNFEEAKRHSYQFNHDY